MPVISRKRARPLAVEAEEDENNAESAESGSDASEETRNRSRGPQQQSQRRRRSPSASDAEISEPEEPAGAAEPSISANQVSKNLVRLALSCEYARIPIRRTDISQKILQPANAGRIFKLVFDDAQQALRQTFGMEMVELPARDKVTVAQRRQAQKSQSTQGGSASSSANKQWILRSVLPEEYRTSDIIRPGQAPTEELEASYIGLYTFIISLIVLSGGTLSESRLDQMLKRTNADESTPVDKRDKLVARMVKEGYIVKIRESTGGEDTIEYILGPRGKMEVGDGGVAGMVRKVFRKGEQGTTAEDDEELERKIERSLKVNTAATEQRPAAGLLQTNGAEPKKKGRPRRNGQEDEDDEDDS